MKAFLSISTQILLAVLITVISVLGFSSIIELNILKQRETQILQDKGALTADRIANSLAYPLWNLNLAETERVVLDEISAADISRIQVFDEHDAAYVGKERGADGAIRQFEATTGTAGNIHPAALYSFSREVNFKNTRIGRVTLDVTDTSFQTELRTLRRGIVIKLVLLALLLSIVLFVTLRVLVIRPVSTLKSWVEHIPSGSTAGVPIPLFKYSGEINSLAEAFGGMSLSLRKNNEELQDERERLQLLNRQLQAEIDERRQAEEQLRVSEERFAKAFTLAPQRMGIIRIEDGIILYVNDRWVRDTGFPREQIVNHPILQLGLLGEAERQRIRQLLGQAQPFHDIEISFSNKAEEKRIALVSAEVIELNGESCMLWAANDITERKLAEDALRASQDQLRALSARLQSAREEEGMRIAREIHDELGGAMTGLKWDLEVIDELLSRAEKSGRLPSVRDKLQVMTNLIESTITTVRRISSELRPGVLDDLGLVAALDWQAQQFHSRTGIRYHPELTTESADLNRESSTAVFRVFQEILTNILRHSQASNFYVRLREHDRYLELEVSDDGRGITESERSNTSSLGLLGMKERALLVGGSVSIGAGFETGTTVTVCVPLAG